MSDVIVGIDLGTTNSEIAAFVDGHVEVLPIGPSLMLPSCVGLSPTEELLVGETARNQQMAFPERTIRSIKRRMGSDDIIELGHYRLKPPEVSSLILKELLTQAEKKLGHKAHRAVITVPAYFSDGQRQATREAGQLAGLEVLRILNEPTAASLAYGLQDESRQTILVYDLGGGTFDASVVRTEEGVTEVLASKGNNQLGGDDFNDLLVEHLNTWFHEKHGIDLHGDRRAMSRLWWAAERAKIELSSHPYTVIREENLGRSGAKPCHLELEISREQFNQMMLPLVESTMECVTRTLQDAGIASSNLDAIILVGGSTRNQLVVDMLTERTQIAPRQDIHPDLCVALGAGILASQLEGHPIQRVLVDVSPYSFGPSFLGERDGIPYPHCYKPIIRRNTPLPVTRSEVYWTATPFQESVAVNLYQGEQSDALRNIQVGSFTLDGLEPVADSKPVLCTMHLDLNGILNVSAIEKDTGKAAHITVKNAIQPKDEQALKEDRARMDALFARRKEEPDDLNDTPVTSNSNHAQEAEPQVQESPPAHPEFDELANKVGPLIQRSTKAMTRMHEDDKAEALQLQEDIEEALLERDFQALKDAMDELGELLFFVEGAS